MCIRDRPLYDADMRQPERTTSLEHQTKFGTGCRRCGLGKRGNERDNEKKTNDGDPNNASHDRRPSRSASYSRWRWPVTTEPAAHKEFGNRSSDEYCENKSAFDGIGRPPALRSLG